MTDQQSDDLKEARATMREDANKIFDLLRVISIGEAGRCGWSIPVIYALDVLRNDEDAT